MGPSSRLLPPLALLVLGCGVPSYGFDTPDASDVGRPDGRRPDSASPLADAAMRDGALSRDAACVPGSVENCTNGVDDDCNGLVDCADPQCSGDGGLYSCTALPTETGWTLVAYQDAGVACPHGYGPTASTVVVSVSGDPDTCACRCTNTQPATCQGSWAWSTQGVGSCGAAPTSGGNPIANGACTASSGTDNLDDTYSFVGAPNGVHTVAGACSATVMTTTPLLDKVMGETCALPSVGGGCASGAVCAPKVSAGFQRCSLSASPTSCPNGLVQANVSTSYQDTRSCSGCACATVDLGCNVDGMHFWQNGDCTGGAYDMLTGCTPESGLPGGNSLSFQADLSTAVAGDTCAPTTSAMPQGAVTTSGPKTVCCEP